MSETFSTPAPEPRKSRRTRILSRPGDQLRTTLVPTLGTAILLVLLLAVVHQANEARTAELIQSNPAFAETLESQALQMEATLATASVIFLVAVLVMGLLHSRRLIGALFAIHRRIRELAEGDLSTRFRLRRSDYFHDVAESLNDVSGLLHRRATEDLADINDLISVIERSPQAGPFRDGLHETLLKMRERKRNEIGAPPGGQEKKEGILSLVG